MRTAQDIKQENNSPADYDGSLLAFSISPESSVTDAEISISFLHQLFVNFLINFYHISGKYYDQIHSKTSVDTRIDACLRCSGSPFLCLPRQHHRCNKSSHFHAELLVFDVLSDCLC